MAFIGEIASGKTTYLAAANGLMLPGEISADDLTAAAERYEARCRACFESPAEAGVRAAG